MNTIQSAWETFRKDAISADAPPIQVSEMRIAFYSGATAMLGITHEIGGDAISEEAGMAILEGLHNEAESFVNSLMRIKP